MALSSHLESIEEEKVNGVVVHVNCCFLIDLNFHFSNHYYAKCFYSMIFRYFIEILECSRCIYLIIIHEYNLNTQITDLPFFFFFLLFKATQPNKSETNHESENETE